MSLDLGRAGRRVHPSSNPSRSRALAVAVCAIGAGLGAGWGAAAIALLTCLPLVWPRVHPRHLLAAAAVLAALVPVTWAVGNAGRFGEISPRLVTENPLPSWLAAAALAVALLGVLLDVVPTWPAAAPGPRLPTARPAKEADDDVV